MDVCWRQAGKHAGGSVRGTDLGMLGDKESIVCWLRVRGSLITSGPGFFMVQESSMWLGRC